MALTPRSLVRQRVFTDPVEAAWRIIDLEEAVHNALEALRVGENKVMRADTAREVLLKVHRDWRIEGASSTARAALEAAFAGGIESPPSSGVRGNLGGPES